MGVVLIALAATIGNLLQGWDNSTIAGAVMYVKKEFNLEKEPTIEGLILAMSLIGSTLITTVSGPTSDAIGRRPMLILSSVLYFISSLVMLWAPNVYVLLFARLLDGFGIGLAVTLVPIYISETAPSEIRGLLNTLPQFCGSGGMFLSYCLVFGLSLQESPSWRLMLGVLSIPSLMYFLLAVFFLPESPRWLVSKGRMLEAKQVLQRLRGREDVSAELALLFEGLGVGKDTSIEEYIIGPDNEANSLNDKSKKDQIRLYGPEEGLSWMAKSVKGQSSLAEGSATLQRRGSSLVDPLVTLFGSVHEKGPLDSSANPSRSTIFPNMGSILSMLGKEEHWDMENPHDADHAFMSDSDDNNIRSPLLLSRQTTEMEKEGDNINIYRESSENMYRRNSSMSHSGTPNAVGIGGGWQLAWKYDEKEGKKDRAEKVLQRMYIKPEGGSAMSNRGSVLSFNGAAVAGEGECVHAAALVSQTAVSVSMMHTDKQAVPTTGPSWREIFEPGVKRALIVGIGLQILQQLSGINGVLYYTPQILDEAGVSVLLSNLGMGSDSASLLLSALTTFLMLPCIALSMRLMDVSGRRYLLLATIPILIVSLLAIVIVGQVKNISSVINAAVSAGSVMIYLSCFVMGFGVIPNILCAEIFPTKVRGVCSTICSLSYWIFDIFVTYTLPFLLKSFGLGGVFGIYAFFSSVSWVFVYLKVPETKGMPLEVITDFFSLNAK